MNAIITCVEFDDYLEITLPWNVGHFGKVLVVTSLKDKKTELLANSFENSCSYATDAFFDDGAPFNKGKALEEGLDILGREGWIMVLDADIVLPEALEPGPNGWELGKLYSPYRRLCGDPGARGEPWGGFPYGPEYDVHPDEFAGYCQIFHALDPKLVKKPWYPQNHPTAKCCDSEFWWRWPVEKRIRPHFEVLHLGPLRENWEGRRSPRWEPN